MTTLENRPNDALLVVDVQNGVVEGTHRREAVVANVSSLVEKARHEGTPVVWVQHINEHLAKGRDAWQIVPELTPGDDEPRVEKIYGASFEDTDLETVLSGSESGVWWSSVPRPMPASARRSMAHSSEVTTPPW